MAGEINAKVEIRGLDQLVRTMRKAGVDMADLKKANNEAGEIVAVAARGAVPHDTGRLGRSIKSAKQARRARVTAGGGIRYARYVEFGSSKIRAHRYLYGSAQRTQPTWLRAYEEDLTRVIGTVEGA